MDNGRGIPLKNRARGFSLIALVLLVACWLVPLFAVDKVAAAGNKNLIYDKAGLLSKQEKNELNRLANEYGAERETDFIIYTSNNEANKDVQLMTEDFYDKKGPGYDKAHGNAVILAMDMHNREIYLAGFYKAKEYLDDSRLDKIRDKITPDLTDGNYKIAFEKYIRLSYKYMGYEPGVNPENIVFKLWFQLGVSIVIAWIIVAVMVSRSGGKVTVDRTTYQDSANSSVVDRRDEYSHTTVTKRRIERSSDSSSGGGGGGGTTSGGHSHSGSRGSF